MHLPIEAYPGFEAYWLAGSVSVRGTLEVNEGYVKLDARLIDKMDNRDMGLHLEAAYPFEPAPLLPPRRKYKLRQALQADPLSVYDLNIEKYVGDTFPEEVFAMRNLEELWIGGQARVDVKHFPVELTELIQLRSLMWYSGQLESVPDEIGNLELLEVLSINHQPNLTGLPDSIGTLSKLTEVNFDYLNLRRLPTGLADLPDLRKLSARGNNFQDLPQALGQILDVKVDRKYVKYYQDTGYKSANPRPIRQEPYRLAHYPELYDQAARELPKVPKLSTWHDFILDATRVAIRLIEVDGPAELPLGASRYGGAPDLPIGVPHPAAANGEYHVFHCQLNCADLAPHQDYLPRDGMLYFFVNNEEYASDPTVIYAPGKPSLKRYVYPDDAQFTEPHLENELYRAFQVDFAAAISLPSTYSLSNYGEGRYPERKERFQESGYGSEDDYYRQLELLDGGVQALAKLLDSPSPGDYGVGATHHGINDHVFTQHESPEEQAAARYGGEPGEWLVLLKLESLGDFQFWDAGTLTYCIHKKDLAINDFSRVHASIESS